MPFQVEIKQNLMKMNDLPLIPNSNEGKMRSAGFIFTPESS